MAKTDFKSIDQYHKAFPLEVAERMQQIRKVVHSVVPDVAQTISYQIPYFKYNGYLVYYSAHTNHISLSNPFSKEFLAEFAEDLKGYKFSKSAIWECFCPYPHGMPRQPHQPFLRRVQDHLFHKPEWRPRTSPDVLQ